MRLSIRWKLLLSISLPLLVVFTIMLVWDYRRVRDAALEDVQTRVLERAQAVASGISAQLETVSRAAGDVADRVMSVNDQMDWRSRLQMSRFRFSGVAFATHVVYESPDGTANALTQWRGGPGNLGQWTPSLLATEPQLAELYQQLKSDPKARWSGVRSIRFGRQSLCTYVEPVLQNGKLRGAVMIDVNVNDLTRGFRRGNGTNQPTSRPNGEIEEGGRFAPASGLAGVPPIVDRLTTATDRIAAATTRPFEADRGGPGDFGPPDEEGRRGGFGQLRERLAERREGRRGTTQPSGGPGAANIDDRGPGGPPEFFPGDAGPATSPSTDPEAGVMDLIDREGKPIANRTSSTAATRPGTVLQWADEHNLVDFIKAFHRAQAGKSGIAEVPNLAEIAPGFEADQTYWIAMAPVTETGWVYLEAVSESKLIGPYVQRVQQRALFLVAGLVVILIVATVVAFRLSRPVMDMADAVRELAEGNLDARVTSVKSQDELGQLARAFNSMTGQLKAYVHALTEQTKVREKAESELRIARQIQTDLLPRTFPPFPDRPEFDLHAVNIPAAGVAGDFYDFFFVADDWLTICIADVSGKGVPAALLMAVTRTIVRNLALAGLPLEQICERANEMLLNDTNNNMFVTMFLAQYQPKTGKLKYVNAGHPRPFIFSTGSDVQLFGSVTSPLLGVCEVCEIGPVESAEAQLEVGQTLLLYTDGVTEARASDGKMLRDPGAMKLVHEHDSEDVATFCGSMVAAIDAYQDHHPADDITILALRRKS